MHMRKLAECIVKKRLLFFILFAAFAAYCVYGITRIEVEYDITKYLPANTDTAKALEIMEDEFAASGSSTVLVENITEQEANALSATIDAIDGVTQLSCDYKDGNALYSIFFAGTAHDARAVDAYNNVLAAVDAAGKTCLVPTPLVNTYADKLAGEMVVIIAIAAAVILAVLLFTSKSFAEVIAFPIVFVVAALFNMGTNHWMGKVSFVSNTVCIILQLALAIDYAIILCHRFTEEKEKGGTSAKEALVRALTKAIPEIASSSLTTVSGLVALMFMQLGLGFDLGMVLAKSIIFSLLTVFFLMPGVLLMLSRLMDRSRHRSFVPKVRFLGRGVVKFRYVFIAAFVLLFGAGAALSQNIDYCYTQNGIDTSRPSEAQIAKRRAEELFGAGNAFVILVPKSESFDTQRRIVAAASDELGEHLSSALAWATVELPSRSDPQKSYRLTDKIDYLDLADISGINTFVTSLVFSGYAESAGERVPTGGWGEYYVEAEKIFDYVFSNEGIMNMAGESIAEYKRTLEFGRSQLVGADHMRLVFTVDLPVESKDTFAVIDGLTPKIKEICPQAVFAGESMSAYDLNASFSFDNILITVLTVLFIFIILAITFRSYGIPVVLVLVIQGAIFMNFSLPVIMSSNLFFFTYLIISAIQMGATIDYAILMTNRYRSLRASLPKKEAVVEAISQSFPTILTSGTIMTAASFLIGFITTDPLIASMGMTLATGTLISIACVLTVLPAALYVLDGVLDKTVLKKKRRARDLKLPNPSLPAK